MGKKAGATSGDVRADSQLGKAEDIPFISGYANAEDARRESLKMPEVQQALKQGMGKLQSDTSWVTPNLMQAMQSRPDLMAAMSNPRIQEAIQLMQKDPQGAHVKYKDDPKVMDFLKAFSGLMATHFDVLSKEEGTKPKPASSSSP